MVRRSSGHDAAIPSFEPMEPRLLLDGHPMITEFMADNANTLFDENDVASDWIEIYNPTTGTISLDDYYLTDDFGNPTQWRFPAGRTIDPNQYLIVFAIGNDTPPASPQELYATFRLSAGGEQLALVYWDGVDPAVRVSEFDYPQQKTDVSYGVSPDYDVTAILDGGAAAQTLIPTGDIGTTWTGTTYTPVGWIEGTTGVGFDAGIPGWAAHVYGSTFGLNNIGDAETVLGSPSYQLNYTAENNGVINYYNTGGTGNTHFTPDNTVPGRVIEQDANNYVIHATGTITVPTAGLWTFGVNSDDGFRLTIAGATTTQVYQSSTSYGQNNISYWGGRGPDDTTGTFSFASAGTYAVDLIYYEGGGGSEIEVYAAQGSFTTWVSGGGAWDLVGDTAAGGLAIEAEVVGSGGAAAYDDYIGTNVETQMRDTNGSAYIRVPFTVTDPGAYDSLYLRIRYDDGFVAYLNGVEVAGRNAPATPAWNSTATREHADYLAVSREDIDISAYLGLVQTGTNVLAIHGLNRTAGDSDFLIGPELADMEFLGWGTYYFLPTPRGPNGEGYVNFVADTTFDNDRGIYTEPFDLVISSDTPDAQIYYTLDGTSPRGTDGQPAASAHLLGGSLAIDHTTVLRAYAYKEGWVPTNVDSQTYIFPADVLTQSPDGSRPEGTKTLLGASFDTGAGAFTYVDDPFGTSNAAKESGQYVPAGGYAGGGLEVYLGPGSVSGAMSGAWSQAFSLSWADSATISVRYRLVMGPGYESSEYGEVVLTVDGTRYGFGEGTSLIRVYGDGNGGPTQDTGWLQAVVTVPSLGAGAHTLRLGAYNNGATEGTEWTEVFLDDVVVTAPLWPAAGDINGQIIDYGMDPAIVNDETWGPQLAAALAAIPTFSLVMDVEDLYHYQTGIYVHAGEDMMAWERPVSIEYFDPFSGDDFQINAGIRIRGGYSRSGWNPKHAFRLFFRSEYGEAKLRYDLFPDQDGATEFDNLDLATAQNYSWAYDGSDANTFLRDIFGRDTQGLMGDPYTRSDYCHLYINGQYFGLFLTQERPEASYAESYFGGEKDEYDIVKVDPDLGYNIEATDGTLDAWTDYYNFCKNNDLSSNANYRRLQGLNSDGSRNLAYPVYLDVDNLVDYMILTIYAGDRDAPVSGFLGNTNPNNFYAIRSRTGDEGWQFFRHDGEHTLDTGDTDRSGPFPSGDDNVLKSNPMWFHQQLCWNAEYRLRFADRVHEYFFNNGLLAPTTAADNFLARAGEIQLAIIAESARWGDSKTSPGYTKDTWQNRVNYIVNSFLPGRTDTVLNQFRNYDSVLGAGGTLLPLYPSTVAPTFYINGAYQHGGTVAKGADLSITAPAGILYYTLDGTDPRLFGGATKPGALIYTGIPINLLASVHVMARVKSGSNWSALDEATFIVDNALNLRITELMYNPAPPTLAEQAAGYNDAQLFEYVELQNTHSTDTINLTGIRLSNGVEFTFPSMTVPAGGYVLVVRNQAAFQFRYGTGKTIAGEFQNGTGLANDGERIELSTVFGYTIQNFRYEDGWFDHTDGQGYSLVARDPLEPDPLVWESEDGWKASWQYNGNPGAGDPGYNPGSVVINEVVAHSNFAPQDWIELYNTTASPITITGWFLSDDPADLGKWQITAPTTIPAYGYKAFSEQNDFGGAFALSEFGEAVYLTSSPGGGGLGGYRQDEYFGASLADVAFGRYEKPSGGKDFVPLVSQTFEGANAAPVIHDVVISEVMYNPAPGEDEFIELYNRTGVDVPLYDPAHPENPWKFTDGILFAFPAGAYVPAGGYALVVPIAPALFRAKYDVPASVAIYGPYGPDYALADEGERIELSLPGDPEWANPPPGELPGYVPYVQAEKLTYDDTEPWPVRADGAGSSLERIGPAVYGNDVANWQVSTTGGTRGAANTGMDTTPPGVPGAPVGTTVSENQIDIVWTAATDPDSGIAGYRVYRNFTPLVDVTTLAYSDTTVSPGSTYTYQVAAINRDGLEGAASGSYLIRILGIQSLTVVDATHIDVVFTETVTAASSQVPGNYSLVWGAGTSIAVTGAVLQSGSTRVRLTLGSSLVNGADHSLAVTGVLSQSGSKPIAPGARRAFHYGFGAMGTIVRDWWLNIGGGTAVSDLTGNPNYPNNPTGRDWRTSFEVPANRYDQYGTRVYGYVVPTVTGDYTFWIASDDHGELWLSTDSNPANKQLIASVPEWTNSRDWHRFTQQQSAVKTLVAGQKYYIEALMKEGGGGDNLAVAWTLPGETPEANGPIGGANLMPFFPAPAMSTVSVEATDPAAAETGSDPGTFVIRRTGNTGAPLLVYYSVLGTAAAGDYTETHPGWLQMAAGVESVVLHVTPVNDAAPEANETIILHISSSEFYTLGTRSATVTILDNDRTVGIAATDADAAEAGRNPGQFAVTRTGSTADALAVYYTVGGTADLVDYTPMLAGQVVIPAGALSATVDITPIDDTDIESAETVVLTLSADAAYTVGTPQAMVTIADDDLVLSTVEIAATDPNAAEKGTDPGEFTVTRTGELVGALTVYYTLGGTAGAGDYTPALTGQVVIPDASDSAVITITPVDDGDQEPDETLVLTLSADPSYTLGTGDEATVTILDNELPVVTAVVLNPDPLRTVRTVSQIEPSGIGVDTVRVTFNEAVTFTSANVVVEKVFVDESGNVSVTATLSPTVGGSGTTEMSIQFANAWQNVIDTWVRIRLTGGVVDGDGHALDGEPRLDSSNLGYIYKATDDLPTGDGTAGGDAIFYVGSLRADMRGFGPFQPNPNGIVDQWDLNGFTSKYTQGNLDADFRGFGPFQPAPNGIVDQWDINGFTSAYTSALTQGKRLWALPTAPEEMAPGGVLGSGEPVAVFAPETSLVAADAAAPLELAPALASAEGAAPLALEAPAADNSIGEDAYAGVLTVSSQEPPEPASAAWSPAAWGSTSAESAFSTDGNTVDLLAGPALAVALGA